MNLLERLTRGVGRDLEMDDGAVAAGQIVDRGLTGAGKHIGEIEGHLVRTGAVDPSEVLSQREPLVSALDAYRAFDERQPGWIKVKLEPQEVRHV